jgi:hypothetical protein
MKKFYAFINEKQEGPLTIEELKTNKINRDTLIWFEGIEDWKSAKEIEELKVLFISSPPPINVKNENKIPPIPVIKTNLKANIPTKKKSKIIVLSLIGILIGVSIAVAFIKYNERVEKAIHEQNLKLHEQNLKILEQEKIEFERMSKIQQEERENREAVRQAERAELEAVLEQNINELRLANLNLKEIQKFKLLRSEARKQQDIRNQLEFIASLESDIKRIESELKKY